MTFEYVRKTRQLSKEEFLSAVLLSYLRVLLGHFFAQLQSATSLHSREHRIRFGIRQIWENGQTSRAAIFSK